MQDVETGTLWSHILGQAMRGPLAGARLEIVPSLFTTWREWRRLHPETTVVLLSRTSARYRAEIYRNRGDFVIGVKLGEESKAWSFDRLRRTPVLNETVADTPILIVFNPETGNAVAWKRATKTGVLTFARLESGQLRDRETGSSWDGMRGICVAGALKGTTLEHIPALISYRRAWQAFYGTAD